MSKPKTKSTELSPTALAYLKLLNQHRAGKFLKPSTPAKKPTRRKR